MLAEASALSATFGPLRFDFVAATYTLVPEFGVAAHLPTGELDARVVREGRETYLVIDHRRDKVAHDPARIELWRSATCLEDIASHLFVLGDARSHEPFTAYAPATSLSVLIEALTAGAGCPIPAS